MRSKHHEAKTYTMVPPRSFVQLPNVAYVLLMSRIGAYNRRKVYVAKRNYSPSRRQSGNCTLFLGGTAVDTTTLGRLPGNPKHGLTETWPTEKSMVWMGARHQLPHSRRTSLSPTTRFSYATRSACLHHPCAPLCTVCLAVTTTRGCSTTDRKSVV